MMTQDRFSELVTKEFIQDLRAAERTELDVLLKDPSFKQRYEILRAYLSNKSADESSDDILLEKALQKISLLDPASVEPRKSLRSYYWIAASIIAFFLLTVLSVYLYRPEAHISSKWVTTKRASKKTITLSDGTKVVLNAASNLLYPEAFNGKNREVTLIGEAFFDVRKDPGHPFIIHTGKMDVRVLGTAFNVKAYPDDLFSETTLIRGKVEVVVKDRPSDKITLKPSEKLIVKYISPFNDRSARGSTIDALTEITHFQKKDTTVLETSWLYNKLSFQDQTFTEIAKMMERTYDVKIDFKDEGLKGLEFTGTFENSSAEDVLKALRVIEPFDYEIKDKRILIQ